MLRSFIHAAKVPVGKSRLVTWIVSIVVAVRLAFDLGDANEGFTWEIVVLWRKYRNKGQKKRRRKKLIIAIVVECVVEGTTTSSAIVGSLALCECMESNMINNAPRPLLSRLCEAIWIVFSPQFFIYFAWCVGICLGASELTRFFHVFASDSPKIDCYTFAFLWRLSSCSL